MDVPRRGDPACVPFVTVLVPLHRLQTQLLNGGASWPHILTFLASYVCVLTPRVRLVVSQRVSQARQPDP